MCCVMSSASGLSSVGGRKLGRSAIVCCFSVIKLTYQADGPCRGVRTVVLVQLAA